MSSREPPAIAALVRRIGDARLADEARLTRRLREVRRLSGPRARKTLERLASDIEASAAWVDERRNAPSAVALPETLPISERADEIGEAIVGNPVVVVCGETGSGKSTQLPKICLQRGFGTRGMIGHTQPRRLAVRSIAARLARELGEPLGGRVGFKIRFHDRAGPDCRVKVMTDGILLAETQHDRWLRQYDALIVDEAHERSLNIDFILGYLKRIRSLRPDLRIVITSATIDPGRFAGHFDDAPVIEVSGRTYPVEDRYRPLGDGKEALPQTEGILSAVEELAAGDDGTGDILVFLAGERDIRETAEALRKRHPESAEVLPLFSRLSAAEQDRIFSPSDRRRVVLATNIAETSLTVPGIRYVVDPGFARVSRYSYRTKIQRLMVEPVSRASADQRRGRCGRQRDGVCIRLYSEEDYLARPEFTDPEIRRTNLASVILQMECAGLGQIEDFPFLDPPDGRFVRDGYRLLRELGAVDTKGRVTRLGRRIAVFPLDPRLGRILVAAADSGCLREILPVVSLLGIQDPRERPLDARDQADRRHRQWEVEGSDLLGILALWEKYLDRRRHLSVNKQRAWCRDKFLSFPRMREWHSVHQQLLGQLKDAGHRVNGEPASDEVVHRAFLTGMLGHIGKLDDGEYAGARGGRFVISRGSALRGAGARWVMAATLVQTERVFAHTVAAVQPLWIEQAASHLVKRSHQDPRWDQRRGRVVATESVSLYGLVLAAGRTVDYGRVDPREARERFIAEALAEDRLGVDAPFVKHNRRLLGEARDLEARLRRRDLTVDQAGFREFFAARVPVNIVDRQGFERWRREAEGADPNLLFMSLADVLADHGIPEYEPDDFPDHLLVEGNELPLEYRFEPGDPRDGLTLVVPRALLPMLDGGRLEWLVPGYLEEKVAAMIRALPKPLRRRLVPAPDVARRCRGNLDRTGDLGTRLARELTREAGVPVEPGAWLEADLAPHLSFNIRVVETDGATTAESRVLHELQERLGRQGPVAPAKEGRRYRGMKDWQVGDLPRTVPVEEAGGRRYLFPALHDDHESVSLVYYASREEAAQAHREGTLRLLRIGCRQAESYLRKEFRKTRLGPLLVGLGYEDGDPLDDLLRLIFIETFLPEGSVPVQSAGDFEARLVEGRGRVVSVGMDVSSLIADVAAAWRECRASVGADSGGAGLTETLRDLSDQLDGLVFPGWLRSTPFRWLKEFPRYLAAARTRLEKVRSRDGKAMSKLALIAPHRDRLSALRDDPQWLTDPAVARYRWMVEEFRVSLFDQRLGTAVKVSPERLERQWGKIPDRLRELPS